MIGKTQQTKTTQSIKKLFDKKKKQNIKPPLLEGVEINFTKGKEKITFRVTGEKEKTINFQSLSSELRQVIRNKLTKSTIENEAKSILNHRQERIRVLLIDDKRKKLMLNALDTKESKKSILHEAENTLIDLKTLDLTKKKIETFMKLVCESIGDNYKELLP